MQKLTGQRPSHTITPAQQSPLNVQHSLTARIKKIFNSVWIWLTSFKIKNLFSRVSIITTSMSPNTTPAQQVRIASATLSAPPSCASTLAALIPTYNDRFLTLFLDIITKRCAFSAVVEISYDLLKLKETAESLLQGVYKETLSLEESWTAKAIQNDTSFDDNQFLSLPEKIRVRIFFVAKFCKNTEFLNRLEALGMKKKPLTEVGPSIFPKLPQTQEEQEQMIGTFIESLKSNGLLLTKEDSKKIDISKFFEKPADLGRIQGRNLIERIAIEYGLKNIKVPKKIIVLEEGKSEIIFCSETSPFLRFITKGISCILAERIESVNRKISLEEATELLTVLIKTGFNDIRWDNIFLAADGIYFIDTEVDTFSPAAPCFSSIKSLIQTVLSEEDKPKFLEEFQRQQQRFEEIDRFTVLSSIPVEKHYWDRITSPSQFE